MQTTHFSQDGAQGSFAPTGFDRFFQGSVIGSRALSRISSRVVLPETVELPTDRPAIIVSNHSSLFDLIASLITLGHYGVTARIGVNSRFFSNPVAGGFLRRLGCIPFSREHRDEAEQTMVDALVAGQVCAMMPEGKLIKVEDQVDGVGQGRPGVSRIARRADAAVVPVGFAQSDLAWPPGKAFIRVGLRRPPIIASFGAPIVFEGDDHEANVAALMAEVSKSVMQSRSLALASTC